MAKKERTQKAGLRPVSEITLENISQYEWEIFKKVAELVEALKKDREKSQLDNTSVRVGKLVVMRGKGYPRPTPNFEAIWGILDKEVYAPRKLTRGAIKVDFLGE